MFPAIGAICSATLIQTWPSPAETLPPPATACPGRRQVRPGRSEMIYEIAASAKMVLRLNLHVPGTT